MFSLLRKIMAPALALSLGILVAESFLDFALFTGGAVAAAEGNKGQDDLDKALEARIDAKSLGDLDGIIKLCRSAIEKGLDGDNTKFAKKLLASTFYQRGETLAKTVLDARRPDPLLPQLRMSALGDLSEAVTNDPEIPDAYLLIAKLQVLPGGDIKQARTMVDKLLTLKTVEAETRAEGLIIRSAFRDKAEDRVADLDEAVRLNPNSPQPLRLRAATKLSMDKPAEAVADFDLALKLEPEHAATHEARGLALAAQKKWDEAKQSLSRAASLVPQSPAAVIQRGRVSMLAGDPKAALADAEAALKITPDMPEAILLRSQARQVTGDKKGALADVDRLLQRFPDAPGALRARITYLVDDGRMDDALKDLDRLAKLEPDDPNVLLQTAVLHHNLKNNEKTVELSGQLLKRDPANWRALRLRGDSYLGMGKQREAINDYEAAVKIESKDSGILNNLAWVLATSPDDKLRNGKRARELAELACEVTDYKTPHMLSTLGAAYAEQGDFEGAKKWLLKAIEVAESDEERAGLQKELASYEKKKPWREAQTASETPDTQRK